MGPQSAPVVNKIIVDLIVTSTLHVIGLQKHFIAFEKVEKVEEVYRPYTASTKIMQTINQELLETCKNDIFTMSDFKLHIDWRNEISISVSSFWAKYILWKQGYFGSAHL